MDEVKVKEKDNRLTFVAVLRKIFGYSIFLMLIYCVVTFREDLNMLNFYRIMSYFDTDTSVSSNFTSYTFEVGIDSVHAPFNGGLVVLNKDSLKIINAAGIEDLSEQLKYKNPQLLTGDKRIVAYDKGGNEISIFGSYALLKQITEENPILWCSINARGDLLVLMEESGYKGSVKLYSEDAKQRFQWSSSEYHIISGCLDESGENLSLLCIGGNDGIKTFIRTYNIHEDQPSYDIDLSGSVLYSMEYDNNGKLSLILNDGVHTYDKNGQPVCEYSFADGSLICYNHSAGKNPVLAFKSESGDYKAVLLDNCKETASFAVKDSINSVFYESGTLLALTNENAYIYNSSSDALEQYGVYAGKSISKRVDGNYLIIFADRAEVLKK